MKKMAQLVSQGILVVRVWNEMHGEKGRELCD